jgi:hypothetical protein
MTRTSSLGASLALYAFGLLASATAAPPESLPETRATLSVEEAYRAIPHRRTVFRFDRTPIPEPERRYLSTMFELIDRGVALRVSAYRSFSAGAPDRDALLEDIALLADFALFHVRPPEGLREYHARVVEALMSQKAFFAEWRRDGERFAYGDPRRIAGHPRVQESSRALREAYGILMSRYGAREDRENRDALFDYHCALDFL